MQLNWVSVLLTNWLGEQVHAPLNARRLPGHVEHWVAEGPEQVKQLEWQLAHWKEGKLIIANWPAGQAQRPFNVCRLPVHVEHWVADEPEQV